MNNDKVKTELLEWLINRARDLQEDETCILDLISDLCAKEKLSDDVASEAIRLYEINQGLAHGVPMALIERAYNREKNLQPILNLKDIEIVSFGGINHKDAMDYCDAFIQEAYWISTGENLTDTQLDAVNDNGGFVHERLMAYLY